MRSRPGLPLSQHESFHREACKLDHSFPLPRACGVAHGVHFRPSQADGCLLARDPGSNPDRVGLFRIDSELFDRACHILAVHGALLG